LKRKSGSWPNWRRILARRYTVARGVGLDAYPGIVSLYSMLRVARPLWKTLNGRPTLLAADDFAWLQFYPVSQEDANAPVGYCATAMIAPSGAIAQWYVDIIAGCGFTSASGAWHNDLYLDLVTAGQGDVELLDAEELEEALAVGAVTPAQYQAAWAEARRLEPLVQALELPEVAALPNTLAALRALETRNDDAPVAGYQPLCRISD
jgi:predicted RNA-binding protein associated with RNAse of E/G family